MKKYIVVMVASLTLIACASAPKPDAPKPAASQPEAAPVKNEAVAKPHNTSKPDVSANKMADQALLAQQLKKDSVYFDFDKSEIKPEFQSVIKKQDDFALANKNDGVTLEGNCDERGSAEYNLALGDRRAQSVSRQLQILGLPKERVSIVSYGEERPRLACHEESCWKENRRVDFVHKLN